MARFGKLMSMVGLCVLALLVGGASSCEQKFEEAQGVHVVKDPANPGHYIVVEDADGGKVGRTLSTAQGAGSGIPLVGQALTVVGLVAAASKAIALSRAKSRVEADNAEYDRTHVATNNGLQSFVDSQPKSIGDALLAELDHAHDTAQVPATHQDALQPVPKAA